MIIISSILAIVISILLSYGVYMIVYAVKNGGGFSRLENVSK